MKRDAWSIHDKDNTPRSYLPDAIYLGLVAIVAIVAVLLGWL